MQFLTVQFVAQAPDTSDAICSAAVQLAVLVFSMSRSLEDVPELDPLMMK